MVNKTKCKEIVAKHEQSHTDSPIKSAVKNLNTKFGVAMKDVVSEAFEQFDADLSKTLDSHEVGEFRQHIYHGSVRVQSLLARSSKTTSCQRRVICRLGKMRSKGLADAGTSRFLKIINFDEFERQREKTSLWCVK